MRVTASVQCGSYKRPRLTKRAMPITCTLRRDLARPRPRVPGRAGSAAFARVATLESMRAATWPTRSYEFCSVSSVRQRARSRFVQPVCLVYLDKQPTRTMPRTLRLVYLPMRGRAEAIRMCLHYYRIQFEDVVLDYDAYAYSKERGEFPFSQVSPLPSGTRAPSRAVL